MAKDLLFEIGTEEIPAHFISPALRSLADLAWQELKKRNLTFESIKTLGTPRRLTLYVGGLAEGQPDREEEVMGPPKSVAFDAQGRPTKAAEGFAKRQGVPLEELRFKETPKGTYVYVKKRLQGQKTIELLPEILTSLVKGISFPKSMRWGSHKLRFARPIRWFLALYGRQVVSFELAGIKAGGVTYGHRFMAPEPIEVEGLVDYVRKLREAYVIVEPEERLARTIEEITNIALSIKASVWKDQELIEENAHLVEFPYAILGSFDAEFLSLPKPVLITAMKEHQRYFAVVDKQGALLPRFIAVNNTKPADPSLLIAGHERVLRARLEDAKFYFERDKEIPLHVRVEGLKSVGYHAKLGSLYDKVLRLEALASWLAQRLAPDYVEEVKRAAHLSKADLLTELVQEFPSLQGIMGKEYALLSGEPEVVAEAIKEHYLPLSAGGDLPKTTAGAILALADKIDTLCAFFAIGERPSGAADPFGLRRAAYGFINIVLAHGFDFSLAALIRKALKELAPFMPQTPEEVVFQEVYDFIGKRLSGELTSRGFGEDLVKAVMAVGFDNLIDTYARLEALKRVKESPDFSALAIGFKRVMNMIKGISQPLSFDESLLLEEAEKALFRQYIRVEQEVLPLIDKKDYYEALRHFIELKQPIDRFFDEVFVMVEDETVKNNRLGLLQRIADLFLRIADLSYLREESS